MPGLASRGGNVGTSVLRPACCFPPFVEPWPRKPDGRISVSYRGEEEEVGHSTSSFALLRLVTALLLRGEHRPSGGRSHHPWCDSTWRFHRDCCSLLLSYGSLFIFVPLFSLPLNFAICAAVLIWKCSFLLLRSQSVWQFLLGYFIISISFIQLVGYKVFDRNLVFIVTVVWNFDFSYVPTGEITDFLFFFFFVF